MTDKSLSFSERRRRLLESRGQLPTETPTPTPAPPQPDTDADLIPDVLSEKERDDLDDVLDGIDIIEAYNKWCGKMRPDVGKKREGIMISCPQPDHRDEHPSAWINLDEQVWNCGACKIGGDKFDIAANHFGISDYKSGANFHELRRKMAEDFGYRFKKTPAGEIVYKEEQDPAESDNTDTSDDLDEKAGQTTSSPASQKEETKGTDDPDTDNEKSSNVSVIYDDDEDEQIVYPSFDWREIADEGTFLYEYCKATSGDSAPEEYHFWHGMVALGHAVGRNVKLDDDQPVFGNLFLCLLGGTGAGKSRSRRWLRTVLEQACPFRQDEVSATGVKHVITSASGEALISAFQAYATDPSFPKGTKIPLSINGIVTYDEMSGLLAVANRQGSTLKTAMMQFADCDVEPGVASRTHGDTKAYLPFCSTLSSTQPKNIRSLMSRSDMSSGFLNRWVFVTGKPKEQRFIGGTRNPSQVDLSVAVDLLKKVRAWGAKERVLIVDDECFEEMDRFFRERILPLRNKENEEMLQRLDLLIKKLILIFAINDKTETPTIKHAKKAQQLFEYLVECYGVVGAEVGGSISNEIRDEIVRHISRIQKSTKRGATANDLVRRMKKYPINQLKQTLQTMVELDMIDVEKPKTKMGRPTVRYKVVI